MGWPHRIGHRVVKIADIGGLIAPWEPARQIAAPDKLGQRARRRVTRFGCRVRAGMAHLPEPGPLHHRTQQRGGHDPGTEQIGRLGPRQPRLPIHRLRRGFGVWLGRGFGLRLGVGFGLRLWLRLGQRVISYVGLRVGGGVEGVVLGDDVDDGVSGRSVAGHPGAAVGVFASAGEGGAVGAGGERVRAPLIDGAGVGVADAVGRRFDVGFHQGGVGVVDPRPDGGDPGRVDRTAELHGLLRAGRHGAAHRPGIVFVDQLVDGLFGFLRRQRPPPGHPGGQLGVHRGHRFGVFDQRRAGDDGAHQQVAEQPVREQGRHLREPVAQRERRGWSDATPCPVLTLTAAASSAATAACGSIHHHFRSSGASPVRRLNSSAIAASLWAAALFSARAHPPAASTSSASVNDAKSGISGNERSNMLSNLPTAGDDPPPKRPAQAVPVDETTTVDNSSH